MKRSILIVVTLCLFDCKNEKVDPVDNTVHLAGFLAPSGSAMATYWKDTVYQDLNHGEISSNVTSLYVDGSSVLIGGWKFVTNAAAPALLWRDGTATTIDGAFGGPMIASRNNNLFGVWLGSAGWVFHKNDLSQPILDTAYTFGPMAMALLGDDIMIAGYSSGPPLPPAYSPPQHAECWKNGQLIFREMEISNALSIFTDQNDIYLAGYRYDAGGVTSTACYWKNGQRIDLTDGNSTAVARSLFVSNSHVYVAGMLNDQAVYWTDGKIKALTTMGTNSMANAIFVKGADVHVAGSANGHPAWWKNDVRLNIQNQDQPGQINFMVVGSN